MLGFCWSGVITLVAFFHKFLLFTFSSGLLAVSAMSIDSILFLLVADFSSHILIILFVLLMMVLKISLKICSRNPFFEIRFRFRLGIKNVKRKKSNFRENFVFISKSCRTLNFNVENNYYSTV